VNNHRRSVRVEHRQRAVAERHARRGVFHRRFAARVSNQVRHVAHVERVIDVGIGVAGRTWIEVATRGRETGRFALADGVQMEAVRAGLEAGDVHGEFDRRHAGHEFHVVGRRRHRRHFAQRHGARDAFAGDRGFGAAALSGNAERSRGRDDERKGQGCSQGEPEHSESFQGGSGPQIQFRREL
jgi:hypothetical protein